ncbi:MAG: TIGR00282 family metallophosphoesterase [Chloroflexi bacterium]|nr:TIGR00282 family metallophosphoesterase [Chloroflexota bacterium]
MRILMVGDIVGRPGREAAKTIVPRLRHVHNLDLVVANGENAAGGRGITGEVAAELFACGIDIITSGNHIWDQPGIIPYLQKEDRLLRPLNYPPESPGRGFIVCSNTLIVNLMGRVFIGLFDCPFRALDRLLETLPTKPRVVIVDFHAEATSEKVGFGWYFDGRVSAVFGTHTHVPTADARILPGGTAYVTDVGMVGPRDSVIGMEREKVLTHFLTGMPLRLEVARGSLTFNSVLIEVDEATGKACHIARLDEVME